MYVRAASGPSGDAFGTGDDEEPEGQEAAAGRPGRPGLAMAGLGERLRGARALLDRPLTSYYLIVGITTLLLCLGLVMVLSTASVTDLTYGLSP